MTQKFELAKPAVQYALVVGDPTHEGSSFFVISLHHTHCDAFSRFLISKEISQILESPSCYAQDRNPERPWFGDYVKDVQLKATNDNATLFWNTYLRGANLSNIHPPDKATINGELEGAIIERIQAPVTPRIANSHSRNPTQIILAAWSMALAKLSGLRDITFGLCRHGRSSGSFMDVRRVMGPLVNALPFRVSLTSNEESVPKLLQRIQTDITTTNKWEHGFSPSIFPSADGNPWVQSLVDLKSELHGMRNGLSAKDDQSAISKMTPRPDLDIYDMKSHWAVLLSIKQQKNAFQVSMYYQKPLLEDEKAGVLFNHFRDSVQALSTADDSVALEALRSALGATKIAGIRYGITSHSPWEDVFELTEAIQAADADLIITLGGCSITDAVKLARLFVPNNVSTVSGAEKLFAKIRAGEFVEPAAIPVINVPTTLSGSEFTCAGGATDSNTGHKLVTMHKSMYADVVILDPRLSFGTPRKVWLSTGVRAIDHFIEGLYGNAAALFIDMHEELGIEVDKDIENIIVRALGNLLTSLLSIKHNWDDEKARLRAFMSVQECHRAGFNGIGASHGIGHQLGPLGVGHGETSCIILPWVCDTTGIMVARLFDVDLSWRLPHFGNRRTWRNVFVLLVLLVKKQTSAM
ncbi:Iron-containing alcohol dehydrogenase [Pyrenophora tritici-repentis]|nr:Iron-containing alcohol dehydrogenase [Pyrenophora tritici-repentis]